jgi:uncharacterized protein YndB with AHSA1/START domain
MKQPHSDAVVFECDLPEPRDKVWRALTEQELLEMWLLPNDLRPHVGTKFQLGRDTKCEVLEAEPGRKLRWRQREPSDAVAPDYFVESFVSFELSDLPEGGTRLRVVHDGFATVATVVKFPARAQSTRLCSMRRAA